MGRFFLFRVYFLIFLSRMNFTVQMKFNKTKVRQSTSYIVQNKTNKSVEGGMGGGGGVEEENGI